MNGKNGNAVAKMEPGKQAAIAKQTGFNPEQVDPFVVMMDANKPYINAAGTRWKMDERFGAGNWKADTRLPSLEEYKLLKMMWGMSDKAPAIIMKCSIIVDGVELSKDYGTATPKNCFGNQKQFEERGIEIATTRALNRAMKQLVANGLGDGNNRYVPNPDSPQQNWFREIQHLKQCVGDEKYYGVLKNYGVEHSNEKEAMTDPEIMESILRDLRVEAAGFASDALFGEDVQAVGDASDEAQAAYSEAQDVSYEDVPEARAEYFKPEAVQKLTDSAAQFGITEDELVQHIASQYGCERISELQPEQYAQVSVWVREGQVAA